MGSQQKNKTTVLLICALLVLNSFDICESRKTSSKNKSKSGSSSSSSSTRVSNTQHANPASFSYSNVAPNTHQQAKPSAPVQQKPAYPVQSQPTYNQAPPATNTRPVGWNVDHNKPVNPPPYPVNQPHSNSPPYPSNTQSHNNPQPMYPQQGPPAYSNYPANSNFNNQPAYAQHPPQGPPPPYNAPYNPQGYNAQPSYNQPQPAFMPAQQHQPSFVPQQPQLTPQFIPVQQQTNSGPGLVKTALVAGAAGLGGAALYNAFKPDNDPKTTVIIVNNTNPAAPMDSSNQAPQTVAVPAEQQPAAPMVQQMPQSIAPMTQEVPPVNTMPIQEMLPATQYAHSPIVDIQGIITEAPIFTTTISSVPSSNEETTKKEEGLVAAVNATEQMSGISPALNTRAQESVDAEKLPQTAKASNGISSLEASISFIVLSVVYTLY